MIAAGSISQIGPGPVEFATKSSSDFDAVTCSPSRAVTAAG